jgi:hypothetical protein
MPFEGQVQSSSGQPFEPIISSDLRQYDMNANSGSALYLQMSPKQKFDQGEKGCICGRNDLLQVVWEGAILQHVPT